MKDFAYTRDFKSRALIFAILLAVSIIVVIPYIWMLSNSFKTTIETLTDPMHIIPQEFIEDSV